MKLNYFQWPAEPKLDSLEKTALPFVFLHGMGGTGQIWRPIAAQLEDESRCIALDQRGHGLSQAIPPNEANQFHAMDYARDVVETLEALQIKKCILVGHSMGVRTALAFATLAPDKVETLVAIDIGISSEWGGGIGLPLATFLQNLPLSFSNRSELREYLFKNCPDESIAQYLSAVSKKTAEQPEAWTFPFDHEALVQTIHQADEAPLGEWLNGILANGIRSYFLRGERSKVWLKPDYEEQKKIYAHPLLEFQEWENCGHGLPFEQRARFVQFLKEKS